MRFKVATADSYAEALEVKNQLIAGFPDKIFQIRRHRNTFTIVERTANPRASKKGKNRGDSV